MSAPINSSGICSTCGRPQPDPIQQEQADMVDALSGLLMIPDHIPTFRDIFEAGYLAREQSMALHTLGMESSDQVERDQAFTRWQQERSNR